jgi:hypothetical protein
VFGFVQAEDLQAVREFFDLVPGVEGHAGVVGSSVVDAEQMASEDPTRGKCLADRCPRGRKFLRRAEGQAEACMNQVGAWQVCLGERCAQDVDPSGGAGRDACAKDGQSGLAGIQG